MIASFCKSMCDFSFRGRSTKKEFHCFLSLFLLISLILLTVILTIAVMVLGLSYNSESGLILPHYNFNTSGMIAFVVMSLFLCVFVFFVMWAFVAASLLSIRRLHDMNYSGVCYWIWIAAAIFFSVAETSLLTMFIGYFLVFGVLILSFADSFPSANKYGKVDIDELIMLVKKQNG